VIRFSRSYSTEALAGWSELAVMISVEGALSQVEFVELYREALVDTPVDMVLPVEGEDGHPSVTDSEFRLVTKTRSAEGQDHADLRGEEIWRELDFRCGTSSHDHPLAVGGGLLERRVETWRGAVIATFLLVLGVRRSLPVSLHIQTAARLFEHVAAAAIANYINGKGVRFGWPFDDNGADSDFESQVQRLAAMLHEDVLPLRAVPVRDAKDHGLDVVAWRSFGDGRPGQSVVLGQCAIGALWQRKYMDLQAWNKIINFSSPPSAAVAFPFVPPFGQAPSLEEAGEGVAWFDVALHGLPFDRVRLMALVRDADLDGQTLHQIEDLLDPVIALLTGEDL
jgi:hypothetical protein